MATREVLQVLADADSDLLGMMKLDQLSQSSAQDRLMDVAKLKLEGTTKLL